jgi:hypothetical protein
MIDREEATVATPDGRRKNDSQMQLEYYGASFRSGVIDCGMRGGRGLKRIV